MLLLIDRRAFYTNYESSLIIKCNFIIGANITMRKENIENTTNILIPNVFSDHEVDIITPVINSACDSVCAVSGIVQ